MKLFLLSGSLALVCASVSAQSNPQPSVASPIKGTITITADEVAEMPSSFIGIKFSKAEIGKASQLFVSSNARAVGNFRALSPLPGQSCIVELGSDGTKWVPGGAGHTAGEVAPADIRALAGFLEAANCKLDYSAEIISNTPSNAASELAYVGSTIPPGNLLAVGFGNEPDNYSGQNSTSYAKLWNTFATASLARDSRLVFKGPDIAVGTHLSTWMGAWYSENSQLPLAYGSQHYYVGGPANCGTCTIPTMLSTRSAEDFWTAMVLQKNAFKASLSKPLPIYLNETNNYYDGGAAGVSNSFASALYAYDFVMEAAQAGFSGTVFMNSDDYSKGYSPLNVIRGYSYGPLSEYYGLYMAALSGYGPMLSTTVNSVTGVSAYTIRNHVDGDLDIVIINKTASNYEFSVNLPSGLTEKGCSAYELRDSNGPSDTSDTGLNIQGAHFDKASQISLGEPFSIPASGSVVPVVSPSYTGLLVKCAP